MQCLRDSNGDGDDYAGKEDALPPLIIEEHEEATALHQWLLSPSGGNWREAGWK